MATQSMSNKNNRQARRSAPEAPKGARTGGDSREAESYLQRGNEQFRELVEDREGQAVLTALALGFGVGLAIGYAISGSAREERYRWDRETAEGLGRKLLSRLDQILPSALTERLHG